MREHQHLLIMGDLSDPPETEWFVERWMTDFIADIEMKPLISPIAEYCDTVGNRGITCICAIETSHIVFHSWDEHEPYTMQLDIYTCSVLDLRKVWKALEVFNPTILRYKFYDRANGFTLIDEGFK